MSKRPRLKNGRLAKESVINQRQKALKAMTEAKQKKRELENGMKNNPKTELCQESSYVCEGNRIVNLKELGDKLICSSSDCQTILSLINITSETREGLHSILKIKCHDAATLPRFSYNVLITSLRASCDIKIPKKS